MSESCLPHKSDDFLALTARWVLPIAQPAIEDGLVLLRRSKIVAVGKRKQMLPHLPPKVPPRDFGEAVILPALINCHVHLELSDCPRPFPVESGSLVSWIQKVIEHRQARGGYRPEVVTRGWEECLRYGVTAVGDIAQPGTSPKDYHLNIRPAEGIPTSQRSFEPPPQTAPDKSVQKPHHESHLPEGDIPLPQPASTPSPDWAYPDTTPAKGVMFLEIIAPLEEKAAQVLEQIELFLRQPFPEDLFPGLAPHAPYTVAPTILEKIIEQAAQHKLPIAFHLAESREELQFLREGQGPFRQLLESRGLWREGVFVARRPIDYLRRLAQAPRGLIVHGNYLADEELDFLADHPHLSLVYCPRTHRHFGHPPYPLEKALERNIRVVLGTDSRASCPDLNLMEDLREVGRSFPTIPPFQILRMATLDAAVALGWEHRLGSLEPGKDADLVIYPLPPEYRSDPLAALLSTSSHPLTFVHSGYFHPPGNSRR